MMDRDLRLLAEAETSLARLIGEAEPAFQPVGALLARAVANLTEIATGLHSLGHQLQGDETGRMVSSLRATLLEIDEMMGSDRESTPLLQQLGGQAEQMSVYLGQLQRIVGETTALAINGKIQASLVTSEGIDFSVFTNEIGRLGLLAAQEIDQSLGRLANVRRAIAAAAAAGTAFAQQEATELVQVRARLARNTGDLVERQRRAASMIEAVSVRSQAVSQRVGAMVGDLQINDIACQRLDHVRIILRRIQAEIAPKLVSAAADLQCRQLEAVSNDYYPRISDLVADLGGLAQDSAALLADCLEAFGGDDGGLFIETIERDISRAIGLLSTYQQADRNIRSLMQGVSQGFLEMTRDLQAIQSIDADMRVMGLNATLKCSRLGDAGRALGVVAQELRVCSRRTEDMAGLIVGLLQQALQLAGTQTQQIAADQGTAKAPIEIMTTALSDLQRLSAVIRDGVERVSPLAAGLSGALTDGAAAIDFHHRLRSEVDQVITVIKAVIGGDKSGGPIELALIDPLRDLTADLYTMDSERDVHQRFIGAEFLPPVATSDALEDLFF